MSCGSFRIRGGVLMWCLEGGGRNTSRLDPMATMLHLEKPVGQARASENHCMKFYTRLIHVRVSLI